MESLIADFVYFVQITCTFAKFLILKERWGTILHIPSILRLS